MFAHLREQSFAVGWSMRARGSLWVCMLVCGVVHAAGPAGKVNVIFQHAPKATGHFARVLAKAEAGDRVAQFQAGLAYETGAGTTQDYGEATSTAGL